MSQPTQQFVRGNTINFAVTFYDVNGNVVTPDTAILNIRYPLGAGVATQTIVLAVASGLWSGVWESNQSDTGLVEWDIKSGNSTPFCRIDGAFTLTANRANPEP